MHNFSCGETQTQYWCHQPVLLYYFAIKVVFKLSVQSILLKVLFYYFIWEIINRANNFVRGVYKKQIQGVQQQNGTECDIPRGLTP